MDVGDAERRGRAGHELREPLGPGRAAGVRVEVRLLADQGLQQRRIDAVALAAAVIRASNCVEPPPPLPSDVVVAGAVAAASCDWKLVGADADAAVAGVVAAAGAGAATPPLGRR